MKFLVWEISSSRCLKTIPVGGIVRSIEWNPNKALSLIAVVADRKLLIINPGVGDHLVISKTDSILSTPPVQASIGLFLTKFNLNIFICFMYTNYFNFNHFSVSDKVKAVVQWDEATPEEWENGVRIVLNHFKEIKQVNSFYFVPE